jgi:glutaredoxin 3
MTFMKKVEIYSTPSCHFCHMAKEYFTANGVAYSDYDVAKDTARRSEMVDKSGQLGVPVIVVDDRDVVVGFDRNRLAGILGIPA